MCDSSRTGGGGLRLLFPSLPRRGSRKRHWVSLCAARPHSCCRSRAAVSRADTGRRHIRGREELGGNVEIRRTCERLRRPAAHIRLPRVRASLFGGPQDCSDDSAVGQCARLTHYLIPSSFRRLPVERPTCARHHPGAVDASRPDTANPSESELAPMLQTRFATRSGAARVNGTIAASFGRAGSPRSVRRRRRAAGKPPRRRGDARSAAPG